MLSVKLSDLWNYVDCAELMSLHHDSTSSSIYRRKKTLLLIVTHSACVLPNAALRVIKEVAGLIPGRGTINFKSPRSTQPSIALGSVNQVLALPTVVKAGCVRLCRVAGNTV